MTRFDLACYLSFAEGADATPRRVRGAALQLIRLGDARWLRHKGRADRRYVAALGIPAMLEARLTLRQSQPLRLHTTGGFRSGLHSPPRRSSSSCFAQLPC